jgi:hypothetical protein
MTPNATISKNLQIIAAADLVFAAYLATKYLAGNPYTNEYLLKNHYAECVNCGKKRTNRLTELTLCHDCSILASALEYCITTEESRNELGQRVITFVARFGDIPKKFRPTIYNLAFQVEKVAIYFQEKLAKELGTNVIRSNSIHWQTFEVTSILVF